MHGANRCACGAVAKVLSSRMLNGYIKKRRRRCPKCGARWNTFEYPEGYLGIALRPRVQEFVNGVAKMLESFD